MARVSARRVHILDQDQSGDRRSGVRQKLTEPRHRRPSYKWERFV